MATRFFFPQDKYGHASTVDVVHAKIHAGCHFTANRFETIGAASLSTIMFTAPTGDYDYHIIIDVQSSLSGVWTLSISPNATGGTTITSYNNDLNSSDTSDLVITHTPTVTSIGTILESHTIGGTSPASKTGGSTDGRLEWILKQGTKHLLVFTADSASTRTYINVYYYKDTCA